MGEGRILVLRRSYGRAEGAWVPPGGLVEAGESSADAAVRETFEETGLCVRRPRLVHAFEWPREPARRVFQFLATAPSSRVILSEEHSEFRWIAPRDYASEHLVSRPDAASSVAVWLRGDARGRRTGGRRDRRGRKRITGRHSGPTHAM